MMQDIQAGYNDTGAGTHAAGGFLSFPSTASKGSLKWFATNNAANYAITCTNASFGQAAVLTIQDPGAAAANFTLDTGIVAAGVGADSPGSLTGVSNTIKIIRGGTTYYVPLYAVNT